MEKSYEVLRLNMRLSEVHLYFYARSFTHCLSCISHGDHRHPKLTFRVCYVNFLTRESVSLLHLATVETLYEKQNTEVYEIYKGDLPLMYSILGKSPLFIL